MEENEELYQQSDEIIYLLQGKLGFLLRYGMTFLFVLACCVLVVLYFIKVPDTLEGKFTLTGSDPPKALVAKLNGRITALQVWDKKPVKKGDIMVVMENTANTNEMNELDSQLLQLHVLLNTDVLDSVKQIGMASFTRLGELQNAYEQFKKANNELYFMVSDRQYRQEKRIIMEKLVTLEATGKNLKGQKAIYEQELELANEAYSVDSTLKSKQYATKTELRTSESARLQKRLALMNLQQSMINNANNKNDIAQQLINLEKGFAQQKNNFIQAYFTLQAALTDWKQRYLVTAPFDGTASFSKAVYEGLQVKAGEPVVFISPAGSRVVAELFVPQINFGKLKTEQRCIVKFDSYNFEEFGVLDGKVYNILDIPQEIETKDGKQNFYMIQIAFNNDLTTSYGKQLSARYGLTGTASIVLDDKSILEKLFLDKFKALFVYQ